MSSYSYPLRVKKFKVVSQTINSLIIKLIKISFRNQTKYKLVNL